MGLVFIFSIAAGLVGMIIYMLTRQLKTSRRQFEVNKDLQTGKDKAAVEHLKLMLAENEENHKARHQLAKLLVKMGKPADAASHCKILLSRQLEPAGIKEWEVYLTLASANADMDNLSEAKRNLLFAREINPTGLEINLRLAKLEYDSGNFRDAFEHAGKVLKLEPYNVEGNLYRGLSASNFQNFDAAISPLKRTLELDDTNFEATLTLGKIYARRGNESEMKIFLATAEKLTSDQETLSDIAYQRGHFYINAGNTEKGLSELNEALQKTKKRNQKRMILKDLLDIYEREKDVSKTIWALKDYLRIEPNNEEYRDKLNYYLELNSNTRLQKFEMLEGQQLQKFCVRLAKSIIPINKIIEQELGQDNTVDILASKTTKDEYKIIQFRFVRTKGELGDMPLRDLYAKMRGNRGEQAVFVTNGTFTQAALDFAQARVIKLINKSSLQKYLEKMEKA